LWRKRPQSNGDLGDKRRYTTLWLFNIAMKNGSFIDDFPIKTSIYKGFSMAMLNNQMVYRKNNSGIPSGHRTLKNEPNMAV
jgi:hypothetical protein